MPSEDGNAVELTLEAMASGARVITGAVLENPHFKVRVDFLVRMDHHAGFDDRTRYAPVAISSHAVARPAKNKAQADCAIVDLPALGLAKPIAVPWRHRTVAGEGQRVAMAHTILREWAVLLTRWVSSAAQEHPLASDASSITHRLSCLGSWRLCPSRFLPFPAA